MTILKKTIIIQTSYILISLLFLLNKSGGSDIAFFGILTISFLVHIISLSILLVINVLKKDPIWKEIFFCLLFVIITLVFFILLLRLGIIFPE